MIRFLKYTAIFLLGFLIAKFWYERTEKNYQQEEIKVVLNSIKNLSKLVVTEGSFSEIYTHSDSKKYFYEYLSFDKKVIITVNAKVEVGYDLSKMEIQIDTIGKRIIINKIPKATVTIAPNVTYFDLQQSQFNTFSKQELNKVNKKSIEKIKETIEVSKIKEKAKTRLFEELSKIYQLSKTFGWQVVNNTNTTFLEKTPLD